MADNYLEKRMDDYARGRLSSVTKRSGGLRCVKIPPVWVLVVNADGNDLLLKALSEAGYKVAFTMADTAAGTPTAQATGCRFYPCGADEAWQRLVDSGDVPVGVVAPIAADVPMGAKEVRIVLTSEGRGGNMLSLSGQDARAAALLAIAWLYPGLKTEFL